LAPSFLPELLGCAYLVDEAGEEAGGAAALLLRGGRAQAVMEAPRHAQQHAQAGRLRQWGTAPGKHTGTKSGLEMRPVAGSSGGGRRHHRTLGHNTAAAGAPEAKNERVACKPHVEQCSCGWADPGRAGWQSWASRCGSFQEAAGNGQAQRPWERVQQAPKLGLQHRGTTGHRGSAGDGGQGPYALSA
jgi:hypothetical protein